MGSVIAESLDQLKKSHYVRKATSDNYWFDFSKNTLNKYLSKTEGNFCIVINGSIEYDDAYIIPYNNIKNVFHDDFLDNRGRWIGTITSGLLNLHSANKKMYIEDFHNRFDLLAEDETLDLEDISLSSKNNTKAISERLERFNKMYETSTPVRKRALSERIARPNWISDYVKKLNNYTCQICKVKGFEKKTGQLYAEAHHLIELHKEIKGTYCTDNIIVVCPTCHRKIHYANIQIKSTSNAAFVLKINNEVPVEIQRNIISLTVAEVCKTPGIS